MIEYSIFYFFQKRIKINNKHYIFLINPKSGKRFGRTLLKILKNFFDSKLIIDITKCKPHVIDDIVKFKLEKVKTDETLYLIIGGGDGTFCSIIE